MDPAKVFSMQNYGKYMNTEGHCEVENGYCVLPGGVTYAAALIRQEGLTDEMVDHYNRCFAPEENLFYKFWGSTRKKWKRMILPAFPSPELPPLAAT